MVLSDLDIQNAIHSGAIGITPTPQLGKEITGCSVDLRIGNRFRRFKDFTHAPAMITIDKDGSNIKEQIEKVFEEEQTVSDDEYFVLKQGEVILAHTHETITIDKNHVGTIEGKSSLARLGVEVHLTSNRINPGWHGQIVLEIANNGPITLHIQPKSMFSSLSIAKLSSPSSHPYNETENKYQGQTGAKTPE